MPNEQTGEQASGFNLGAVIARANANAEAADAGSGGGQPATPEPERQPSVFDTAYNDTLQEHEPHTEPAPEEKPAPEPETGTPPPATSIQAAKYTIAGREFTGEELTKAYTESSSEGRRQRERADEANDALAFQQDKIIEMEDRLAELAKPTHFNILSDEQIDELSPAKAAIYAVQLNDWQNQQRTAKESRQKAREEFTVYRAKLADMQKQQLEKITQEEPEVANLKSSMDKWSEALPELDRNPVKWQFLFAAAYGLRAYEAQRKANTTANQNNTIIARNGAASGGKTTITPKQPASPAQPKKNGVGAQLLDTIGKRQSGLFG